VLDLVSVIRECSIPLPSEKKPRGGHCKHQETKHDIDENLTIVFKLDNYLKSG
jgi:hypothetical protein